VFPRQDGIAQQVPWLALHEVAGFGIARASPHSDIAEPWMKTSPRQGQKATFVVDQSNVSYVR
jgi:hypothetical protein